MCTLHYEAKHRVTHTEYYLDSILSTLAISQRTIDFILSAVLHHLKSLMAVVNKPKSLLPLRWTDMAVPRNYFFHISFRARSSGWCPRYRPRYVYKSRLIYRLVNVSLHQMLWLNILYPATGWSFLTALIAKPTVINYRECRSRVRKSRVSSFWVHKQTASLHDAAIED